MCVILFNNHKLKVWWCFKRVTTIIIDSVCHFFEYLSVLQIHVILITLLKASLPFMYICRARFVNRQGLRFLWFATACFTFLWRLCSMLSSEYVGDRLAVRFMQYKRESAGASTLEWTSLLLVRDILRLTFNAINPTDGNGPKESFSQDSTK